MDQTLIYILIIMIIGVLMLCLALVLMYIRVTRKYLMLRTAGEGDNDTTIIGNAKKIAEKIIADAETKSKLMLGNVANISGNYAENIEKELKSSGQTYIEKYNRALQESENKLLASISMISGKVTDSTTEEIGRIRESLKHELEEIQKSMSTQIQTTYSQVQLDLSEYKKARMNQIDSAILDLVEEVSRKVLVKEINASEHEKLVMKALEEAKRQNIF